MFKGIRDLRCQRGHLMSFEAGRWWSTWLDAYVLRPWRPTQHRGSHGKSRGLLAFSALGSSELTRALQFCPRAVESGADDQDPWPALLALLGLPDATLAAAKAAASRAIEERFARMADARLPASAPSGRRAAAVWGMATAVRAVERAILQSAAGAVAAASMAELR